MGERIRAARNAAGLTQGELADRIGSSQQNVGKWEGGTANPPPARLVALCRELGVSADHLLGLDDEPPPVSVERAIGSDPKLSDAARRFLRSAYRAALAEPGASA